MFLYVSNIGTNLFTSFIIREWFKTISKKNGGRNDGNNRNENYLPDFWIKGLTRETFHP
jgi:hypothetical protein